MNKAQTRSRLIDLYAEVAAEVFPRHFAPNCCLNGTRVFLEVAKALKLPAAAVSVDMLVCNGTWVRLMEETGAWPKSQAESDQWAAAGAWALAAAGTEPVTPDGWAGHLVAVSCGRLVDSAAGQTSRPHRGIEVPWVNVVDCPPGFVTSGRTDTHPLAHGATLSYRAVPRDDYKSISGFQLSPQNRMVRDEILAEMYRRHRLSA